MEELPFPWDWEVLPDEDDPEPCCLLHAASDKAASNTKVIAVIRFIS